MVFDFLGDKKKVVIAMAHIGALPGSPLYDADGGVNKLIDGVLKDIEALQTGGVDVEQELHVVAAETVAQPQRADMRHRDYDFFLVAQEVKNHTGVPQARGA